MPWANGRGTTSLIARRPDDDQWEWRLSLAQVTTDGPFSSLPGVDRVIAVATGNGMALTIGDGSPVRLDVRSTPLAFDGGAEVICRLLDGPIVDLNLMVRRGAGSGVLTVHSLAVGAVLELAADVVAIVLLDGSVACSEGRLERFDAVVGPSAASGLRAITPARLALAYVHLVSDPSATLAVPGD